MSSRKKIAERFFTVLLSLTFLAACTGQRGEPTPDANAIFTAAAQTVAAQLSQTAAAQPTNTNTPPPTNTIVPTRTVGAVTLPALPGPGSTLPGLPTVQLPSLATATRQPVATGDKCEWQRNDPADGAVIDPKTSFDLIYYLKNTGTSTWTKSYKLRYYVGDYFTDAREFNLLEDTPPGQTGRAIADATAPSTAGTYKATFVLTNDQGVNFCVLDYTFKVGSSLEATQGGPTSTKISLDVICASPDHNGNPSGTFSDNCKDYCPKVCQNWYLQSPQKACYINPGVIYNSPPTCIFGP